MAAKTRGFLKLTVKITGNSFAEHYLFVKEHRVRDTSTEKPLDRTLFVINVPPYYNDAVMKDLFKSHGEVDMLHFHSKPTSGVQGVTQYSKYFPAADEFIKGFKVAYVVFKNRNGLRSVMELPDGSMLNILPEVSKQNSAMLQWIRSYNYSLVDSSDLQRDVDQYMELYDESVEKEVQKAKESEGVPDSDGWVTVTKHGKRPVIPRHEAVVKKISRKEKTKRSQRELLNFYTFQIKQTKIDNIAQLRKRFEEDKKRVELMKMTRKFKPF